MRNRKGTSKQRVILPFLIVLLLCCGCGQQADGGTKTSDGETDRQAEVSASLTVPSESSEAPAVLEMASLLNFEDPETENLAGLLQENSGGMMVRLEAGRYLGSGILYRQEEDVLLILTAAHVLLDAADGVKITFVDGWVAESSDFMLSELADMAVVRLPMAQIPQERLGEYFLANVDKSFYDKVVAEDGCIVMGCRTGVAEDAYEGIVLEPWIYMEDYGQYMMWVSAAGKPGMSGGGLFDRRGRFLGILSGRSEDGEWAVVPLSFVLTEYQ